jgi:hypothetical protein
MKRPPTLPSPSRGEGKKRRANGAIAATFLLALLLASPAAAQTSKETPGRITPTDATSRCLGTPRTPSCGAETLVGCLTRADPALCRAVAAATPPRSGEPMQVEYVIERESLIRPEDITEDMRDLDWYKPGYALVEMLHRACPATQTVCDETWDDVQVYLRRAAADEARWEVVHWRSDTEPDVGPDLPEAFLRKEPASP